MFPMMATPTMYGLMKTTSMLFGFSDQKSDLTPAAGSNYNADNLLRKPILTVSEIEQGFLNTKNDSDSGIQKSVEQASTASSNCSDDLKLTQVYNSANKQTVDVQCPCREPDFMFKEFPISDNKRNKKIQYDSPTNSSYDSDIDSLTSDSGKCCSSPNRRKVRRNRRLPPIGVFWDIENCQVPRGRNAVCVVQQIRDEFFTGYREAEFLVVCDVRKENAQILQELNDAQVNLVHVASTCKNAADEKLRQAIRRFADTYKFPSAIVLITSDINFATDLSDLRHRKRIHIILLHNTNVSEALLLCAQEHYIFTSITDQAPMRDKKNSSPPPRAELIVSNLPKGFDVTRLRNRLRQLSDNCGGKVICFNCEEGSAKMLFSSFDWGIRAQKRMDGEDVFGHKISVSFPRSSTYDKPQSPFKPTSSRKLSYRAEMDSSCQSQICTPFRSGFLPAMSPLAFRTSNSSPYGFPDSRFYAADGRVADSETYFNRWLLEQQIKQDEQQYFLQNTMDSLRRTPEGLRRIRGRHGNMIETEPIPMCASRPGRAVTKAPIDEFMSTASTGRYCAIPSPFTQQRGSLPSKSHFNHTYTSESLENTFQPIRNYPNTTEGFDGGGIVRSNSLTQSVELIVSNLDANIEPREMRRTLLSLFRDHARVLQATVYTQTDGNIAAAIKVASAHDAQFAISKLHRKRIGHKRITISYANTGISNPQQLKSQIIGLLQDVPGKKLPLFKFRELFETRYHTSVSVSELYRLREVCTVIEDPSGRMVTLNGDSINSTISSHQAQHEEHLNEVIYCSKHVAPESTKGWAELEVVELPNVRIGLKLFTGRLHILLQSHMGILPLQSLPSCYEAEIHEPLPIDETGVPLEHLVTCVAGVELRQSPAKQVIWSTQISPDDITDDGSSYSGLGGNHTNTSLATQLALFSREMVDLLRTTPNCRLSFNRFIPAYHHHFGRQCRVADYGFTKLIELFDSLTHIVQIIGEGNRRTITLSHRAQIRRFTGDLLRVLKASASRQVTLKDFATAAERSLGKPWDPVHYGVCELEDLLSAIPEQTIVVTKLDDDAIIALPKREQTPEEIARTQQFAVEVIELLRHAPQCAMLFNKFVPAYHHHFNHQCRVADYGFTKLIELFEAIPEIVKIEDIPCGDRLVRLTKDEALRILASQIEQLILWNATTNNPPTMPLSEIPPAFLKEYGFTLQPDAYDSTTLEELIERMHDTVNMVNGPSNEKIVQLIDRAAYRMLGLRLWRLMLVNPKSSFVATILLQTFRNRYNLHFELNQLEKISTIVKVVTKNNEIFIELTTLYLFAAQAYTVLYDCPGGSVNLTAFEELFLRRHGVLPNPAAAGCPTLIALIHSLPDILILTGRRAKRNVTLNRELASVGVPLPASSYNNCGARNSESLEKPFRLRDETQLPLHAKNDQSSLEYTVQEMLWPAKTHNSSTHGTYEPPKPDTPPTEGTSAWREYNWITPPHKHNSSNLSIQLPTLEADSLPDSPCSLISPARYLLPACVNPLGHQPPPQPPHPSTLPEPNLDTETESTDSSKTMDVDRKTKSPSTPARSKRRLRVAAQFNSPISLA